jgi:flagellar biosynthesis protein FlhF
MKIKRFVAEDMRSALRKVSEILGPDAVILSNNRVDEGVEIVAAIDYDDSLVNKPEQAATAKKPNPFVENNEALSRSHIKQRNREAALDDIRYARNIPAAPSQFEVNKIERPVSVSTQAQSKQHLWTEQPAFMEMQSELKSLRGLLVNQLSGISWGNEVQYHPLRARLLQRLMSLGLSPKLSKDIATKVNEEKDFEHNWRMALGELAHRIPVGENEIIEKGGIVALVGATGVGKTTTIAKLAARYTLKHGAHRVALITTDNYRVAAHEQLRSYARIMGVPMRVAGDADSLREALDSLQDKELILIDTAGMSQRDMLLNKQFAMLQAEGLPPIKTYLTLATNCQRGVLTETGDKFKEMKLAGCILTKVDETTSMGGAITVAVENDLPISYFCDGQQVPEDIHMARAHSIVSRSVSVMQHMAAMNLYDEATSLTIGGMVASGNR